ncbi:MAG: glycosyltransferase family 2 protein [Lachnospiraceae bacterium]|nr:glycosyltransferase family 2 protein [Lachnospiraceae bacterium]
MEQVSVILSTYNGEKYLAELLTSILTGTYKNILIEVSDDGSTDRTLQIIEEYQKKYPEKIIVHQNEKNLGYTKNFLQAAARSKGDYIMFCDQDDIWLPDKVEKTLAKLKEVEGSENIPVLVFTDAWLYDTKKGVTTGLFHESSHLNVKKVDISHLLIENKCIGCTVMFNKRVRAYIQVLSGKIRVHDWWIALICSSFGKIAYLDEPTLKYRQHGGNMIGGTSFGSYFMNRLRTLKEQRQTVVRSVEQAEFFYDLFADELETEKKQAVKAFSELMKKNWLMRRCLCIRYGFWKSGFSRNVGLFLIL